MSKNEEDTLPSQRYTVCCSAQAHTIKGGQVMYDISLIEDAAAWIEEDLAGDLRLDTLAQRLHASPYSLHRQFARAAGIPPHAYIRRRRLTEAARQLCATDAPLSDIALCAGFSSQQAFYGAFSSLYKMTPTDMRAKQAYYPLTLPLSPARNMSRTTRPIQASYARAQDESALLSLTAQAVDGYPRLSPAPYTHRLREHIAAGRALILRHGDTAAGMLCFNGNTIEVLAVLPSLRGSGAQETLLAHMRRESGARTLATTTFRAGDPADTGYRAALLRMGFAPQELMTEYGYPTQRLVWREARP